MIINHRVIILRGSLIIYPRSHGTSSMLQHIKKNCKKKYHGRFDKTQSKLSFEAKRE
jgi:hypothetical protein